MESGKLGDAHLKCTQTASHCFAIPCAAVHTGLLATSHLLVLSAQGGYIACHSLELLCTWLVDDYQNPMLKCTRLVAFWRWLIVGICSFFGFCSSTNLIRTYRFVHLNDIAGHQSLLDW